ncbi:MAG: DUF4199 domain-containing protein [Pyrinomonadaceae bacterium]|nr:DUF4199 domain-containing protein [Pyrinomonadaceae bacterium]
MKKTVLTFGLISGAISSLMLFATVPFVDQIGFDNGMIIGYTTMVISFLLVFFSIRWYREEIGGGKITFGRAFAVGILTTLISCVFYVVSWEIIYFNFLPDFAEKYASYALEKARAAGASQQALETQKQQLESFGQMYKNPVFNAAITFLEPFPVGLLITLISAGILRRREPKAQSPDPAPAQA